MVLALWVVRIIRKEITANCTDLTRGLNVLNRSKTLQKKVPLLKQTRQNKTKAKSERGRRGIYHAGEVFKTPWKANPSGTAEVRDHWHTHFHFLHLRTQIPLPVRSTLLVGMFGLVMDLSGLFDGLGLFVTVLC